MPAETTDDQLRRAMNLLKQERYSEARALLRTINHPKAREWLTRLERAKPEKKSISLAVISSLTLLILLIVSAVGVVLLIQERNAVQAELIAIRATLSAPTITALPTDPALELTATRLAAENATLQWDLEATRNAMAMLPTSIPTSIPTTIPTFAELPTIAPVLTPTPLIGGKWIVDTDTSALTDRESIYLFLEAEEPVPTWLGTATPTVVLRCDEGRFDAYVATGSQVESGFNDQVNVRIRFDDDTPIAISMDESTGGDAMFFQNDRQTLNQLLQHNRMVLGYRPYNAGEVEAIFDLRGLPDVVQPLLDACPA